MPRINGGQRPPGKSAPIPATEPDARPDNTPGRGRRHRTGEFVSKYGSVTISIAKLTYDVLTGRWP